MKRLFSLNLVLIMLISLLSSTAFAANVQTSTGEHSYEQYIVIDGMEYDASDSLFGEGWAYLSSSNTLFLRDYTGKSISTNISLTIQYIGNNTIRSDTGYGIYSSQDLTILSYIISGSRPTLSVFGKLGYEAIRSDGTLTIEPDYFTALGGKVKALTGNPIILDTDLFTIRVGNTAATAVEGAYANQTYFRCERKHNSLTLNGNGGTTATGKTTCQIYCAVSTPDVIDLFPHAEVFNNEDKLLLGWSASQDGSGTIYPRDGFCDLASAGGETTVYALWEGDVYKAVCLENYYANHGSLYYTGEQRIDLGIKEQAYVLPEQIRSGFVFNGWRGEDGLLYPAGTTVMVSGPMKYTAEFTAHSLTVAGREYDSSMNHGSSAMGWRYRGGEYSQAYLDIYNNYSGDPINIPGDIYINLHGSVSGAGGVPAINVNGDATISVYMYENCTDNPVRLTGGDGAPAIQCTGALRVYVHSPEDEEMELILQGGENQPALSAKTIHFSSCKVYADAEKTTKIDAYAGENYLLINRPYEPPITPATPEITVSLRASDGKPQIKWNTVDNAITYELWYCSTKNGNYTKLYTTSSSNITITHTGARAGEDYFYKVRAVNGSATSEFSAIKGVWCDLPVPTVKVTNRASDGKPVISWTAVEGATGYEVYRCGTKNGNYVKMYTAPANDFDIVHIGAAVGNDYFYKVRAIYGDNTKCNSTFSTAKGVWCDLKAPSIKVSNRSSDGKPIISWAKVDYAVGYKVYCAIGSSTGTYKQIYSTTNPDKLSVTHIGAKAGEAYFYKVVAVHKNSKCTSAMSPYKGVYCDLARPTLTVTLNSSGKPYLSWTESTGAASYKVYRSNDKTNWTLLYTAKPNDFDVIHTGAKIGITYHYKVIAACGTTSKGNSASSAVLSITAK